MRTSLKELAEMLLNLTGCNKEIDYAPRSQATWCATGSATRKRPARRSASPPAIDLDDGLRRLIDWRQAHKSEVEARRAAVGLAA